MASSTATKTKTVTKNVYLKKWPEAIRNTFTPTYDEDDLHVIKLKCNVCYKHVDTIKNKYSGKIVDDVITYGLNGSTHILLPNFNRHVTSQGHEKCVSLETGRPSDKRQTTLNIGSAITTGINAVKP